MTTPEAAIVWAVMSLKRQRSSSPPSTRSPGTDHDVWESTKIEDRASIFVAYFSPTIPPRELQSKPDLKSATHRMLAWRKPGSQRTLVAKSRAIESGSDDDGENYGGKRALKVLEEMRVEGALVIARWYGGVMLGPVRFSHIEDTARAAIRAWQRSDETETQKRRKVEAEAGEKVSLVIELKQRDESIKVLRTLLEEKTAVLNNESIVTKPSAAPAREVDYASMTLERLRQMDKARDGTVAFLLKRIDETEKQLLSSTTSKLDEKQIDTTTTVQDALDTKQTQKDREGSPAPLPSKPTDDP